MKIYYVAAGNDGCGFYRAFLPSRFLNRLFTKTEISIDWFDLPHGTPIPAKAQAKFKSKLEFADKADIIVLQRPEHAALLANMANNRWRQKFVYENDDIMWGMDKDNPMSLIPRNKEIIELLIQGAHHVTTTTEYLKRHYQQYNKNVSILPNSIDFSLYQEPIKNDTGSLRILFTGSVTHLENMRGFHKVLQAILDKYPDVTFVLHGQLSKETLLAHEKQFPDAVKKLKKQWAVWDSIPKRNIEHLPFVPSLFYPAALAQSKADLAVIPRKANDFNKAKSNIKYVELAAAKIPVIAQTFPDKDSPYDKDITSGVNGYLADTANDWLEAIENALSNKDRIIKDAYEYVREHYDIRKNIQLWKECYQQLLSVPKP